MLISRFPFDTQFDRFFRLAQNGDATRRLAIPVDVREEADRFVLAADLPGFARESIKLSFDEGALVLAGERKEPAFDKTVNAHRAERHWGTFERRFTLPSEVDASKKSMPRSRTASSPSSSRRRPRRSRAQSRIKTR